MPPPPSPNGRGGAGRGGANVPVTPVAEFMLPAGVTVPERPSPCTAAPPPQAEIAGSLADGEHVRPEAVNGGRRRSLLEHWVCKKEARDSLRMDRDLEPS